MSFSVFGYGSLVNRATLPPFVDARPATVTGWRRAWRATSVDHTGGVCSLSVVPADGVSIEGLLVTFSDEVRPVIDAREHRYDPLPATVDGEPVIIFRAHPDVDRFGDAEYPVHLSYVDCIVQGFLREFGADGVHRFMATTDGWHVPVLDDRAAPHYPRAQALSDAERQLVDEMLMMVDATVVRAE